MSTFNKLALTSQVFFYKLWNKGDETSTSFYQSLGEHAEIQEPNFGLWTGLCTTELHIIVSMPWLSS